MKKIILILAVVVIIVAAAYYLYPRSGPVSQAVSNQSSTTVPTTVAGWQVCNYPAFEFSVSYPSDWEITARGNAQGAGDNITLVTCGVTQPIDILEYFTFAHSRQATTTTLGGMDLEVNNQVKYPSIEAYLQDGSNSYYAHKYPLVSTTTVNGYPIGMLQGNRVIILTQGGTYTMTFGTSTATSTREDIIQTFRFVPESAQ